MGLQKISWQRLDDLLPTSDDWSLGYTSISGGEDFCIGGHRLNVVFSPNGTLLQFQCRSQCKISMNSSLSIVHSYLVARNSVAANSLSVQNLSSGQKQRVAIAGALAEACKVLLLDELTTFLDETDQLGVIKAVRNSLDSSEEVTALWVTHRLEELEYADGAVYMEDGRVVKHGDAKTILEFIKGRQSAYIKQINS
ncbi:ABC transporter I family member 10-like [Cannabis sativa]|uniref:ABC transporter I family member 10-like n=1 Tax=Cannabis sativa TaxID=3483 RepID=UPI0029C9F3CE|nr:ABC transporter I family member 10-like [Cannabis sativa]